jgi:hypothetical protein
VESARDGIFPILCAANRHQHPSFGISFFITAQTAEFRFAFCVGPFLSLSLGTASGVNMRPAPLAPSAFLAPPKRTYSSNRFATLTAAIG